MIEVSRNVLIAAGVCLVAACSKEPEPNTQFQAGQQMQPQQNPQQTAQYPQQTVQPAPQQAAPGAVPGALPTTLPTGLALPIPNAPAGAPAQQLDASAGALAQPFLNQLASTQAPGAKPLGSGIVGTFATGQQLESVITMQQGKTYTVIAVGLPPVSEVNIQLATVLPACMSPVFAQDQATGPQAVVTHTYPWPLPGQVKVIVSVPAGQGIVAAQVYEK